MEQAWKRIGSIFRGNRRQMLTAAAAVFIVYVLLLAGIFSYFHSADEVTNRIYAKNGSLTIHEPLWDQEGQAMAAASEPGMIIKKNPYAYNDGQINLYVRLNMTVKLEEYQGRLTDPDNPPAGWVGVPTDAARLRAILNAMYLQDGSPFLTLDSGSESIADWRVTGTANTAFVPGETVTAAPEGYTLSFYCIVPGTENMLTVGPGEYTDELFHELRLPVYKKDWLGVFDQPYTITVWAEGIPVQPGSSMTAEQAILEFPALS